MNALTILVALQKLRQWWCGIHIPLLKSGHTTILRTYPGRMDQECTRCLHTSPGWRVGPNRVATLDPLARKVR